MTTTTALEAVCANCGQRITRHSGADHATWAHPDHDMHTVCDWTPDMAPTDRVATPTNLSLIHI